jgi:hypothetical protein
MITDRTLAEKIRSFVEIAFIRLLEEPGKDRRSYGRMMHDIEGDLASVLLEWKMELLHEIDDHIQRRCAEILAGNSGVGVVQDVEPGDSRTG